MSEEETRQGAEQEREILYDEGIHLFDELVRRHFPKIDDPSTFVPEFYHGKERQLPDWMGGGHDWVGGEIEKTLSVLSVLETSQGEVAVLALRQWKAWQTDSPRTQLRLSVLGERDRSLLQEENIPILRARILARTSGMEGTGGEESKDFTIRWDELGRAIEPDEHALEARVELVRSVRQALQSDGKEQLLEAEIKITDSYR